MDVAMCTGAWGGAAATPPPHLPTVKRCLSLNSLHLKTPCINGVPLTQPSPHNELSVFRGTSRPEAG
jgi:hypothetical protein